MYGGRVRIKTLKNASFRKRRVKIAYRLSNTSKIIVLLRFIYYCNDSRSHAVIIITIRNFITGSQRLKFTLAREQEAKRVLEEAKLRKEAKGIALRELIE